MTEFERASRVIAGGVNSPVRAFRAVGGDPLFIERGAGATICDTAGRTYLDYVMSWGPLILGHAREEVVRAVQDAAKSGLTFGAPTVRESELAEEICFAARIEQVRFVSSGTEAAMSAVRLARAFTGREKVIKFAGNYHGHADGMLVRAGSGCMTGGVPDSLGVPAGYAAHTLVARYNDLQSVRALLEENPAAVACVILEPVAANMGVVPPEDGFLQGVRALCDRYGALLVFDEVITGFRVAYGGAAERYGVAPDLAVYGKIVGGGMPLAAYGGRREIMQMLAPSGKVYQAGTLSGNPVATAAGLATLRILRRDRAALYPALEEKGAALQAAYERAGVPCARVGSLLTPFFAPRAPRDADGAAECDLAAFARYFHAMLDRGVYVPPSQFEAMFLSAAHTAEDIRRTADAVRESLAR